MLKREQCARILTASGRSDGGGMDALVPSTRWQEDEESMRKVDEVIHNAGGLAKCRINHH